MAAQRSVAAILRWSWWRRWHQAWARYYHYRRRQSQEPERETAELEGVQAQVRKIDVAEVAWSRLAPVLPAADRVGRPYDYARRLVFDAIVHVKQTDCGWRQLPSHFPPWQTVYAQLAQWRKTGIWDTIWSGLDQPRLTSELQL